MKASIYQTRDGIYLAILTDGQQIMRGSLTDLADALRGKGILTENLLFGDWQQGTELLVPSEQIQLKELMLRESFPEQETT
jgi:hypothetical protein